MKYLSKKTLLTLIFLISFIGISNAQQKILKKITITGTVTDHAKMPVKGALIFIDSLKTKTKTNKKGVYKIKLYPDAKMLTAVSYDHGMVDINFTGQGTMDFVFSESTKPISKKELKSIGYGRESYADRDSGYDRFLNIFEVFKVKFASDVNVIGQSVIIKGRGQKAPLFFVDGVEVNNIALISPLDIKSIEVDKKQTSLYGFRGRGGVIKIKLKKR